MSKRVFIIVLDSCGIGQAPDAADFNDHDCNTMKRISTSKYYSNKNTKKLGLANIEGCEYLTKIDKPIAAYGRCQEKSNGKDTITGHWEIAGIVSEKPMPTYPNGFPKDILDEFSKQTGRGVLCNKPYSGTKVIADYGNEHIKTGSLIVYTSADSVFQIASHEEVVPLDELYEDCRIARKILKGDNAVGRVIARPFIGENGNFVRTSNRHDFSLEPPKETLLDCLYNNGYYVYSIGKIHDIFAGRGMSDYVFTKDNKDGMQKTLEALDKDFEGLCFTNLVDFDMLYGHRQDIDGYAKAYAQFDKWLSSFMKKMKSDDILVITADHGCDPGDESTDHSREYIPLLVYGECISPLNLGTRNSFADIAASIADYFDLSFDCPGTSFMKDILLL